MQYCPGQDTLYVLQSPLTSFPPPADISQPYMQQWDTVSGKAVAGASEFMEGWSLKCFCVTDQDSSGNEVIAGAVSGKHAESHTIIWACC